MELIGSASLFPSVLGFELCITFLYNTQNKLMWDIWTHILVFIINTPNWSLSEYIFTWELCVVTWYILQ